MKANFFLGVSFFCSSWLLGSGFIAPGPSKTARQHTVLEAGKKLNEKIDLSSPKVVNTVELAPGEKKVFCRCWLSDTFPLCNGAHQKHNEQTGDNVGPLIVSVPKQSS